MASIKVPSDQANIAAAYIAADPGDEIILEAAGSPFSGAWNRNLTIDKPITIRSESSNPKDIEVDCGDSTPFVAVNSPNVTIKDFTIMRQLGGIQKILIADYFLADNLIFRNCNGLAGSAMFVNIAPHDRISNILSVLCKANIDPEGVGGAFVFKHGHTTGPQVWNLGFVRCEASYAGGGMAVDDCEGFTFFNLSFSDCYAGEYGGAIVYDDAGGGDRITLYHSAFHGNAAGTNGQIIAGAPNLYMSNCTGDFTGDNIFDCDNVFIQHPKGTDPLFTAASIDIADSIYLMQKWSGAPIDSPCRNGGLWPVTSMPDLSSRTTKTNGHTDTDLLDIGYHYYTELGPQSEKACVHNVCTPAAGPSAITLGYPEFAGMLSGTIQAYRGNRTARKIASRIGIL